MKKTTVKTISGAFIFACALMLSPVLRAQVPGTPYIVPSPPSNATPAAITIDCSSYWLYYNGVALKENVAASGQEIYITINSTTAVSGVTVTASTPSETGTLKFQTPSAVNLSAGNNVVRLTASGTANQAGSFPITWSINGSTSNIDFNAGNATNCNKIGVGTKTEYGDFSIIFADNNGMGSKNWGPNTMPSGLGLTVIPGPARAIALMGTELSNIFSVGNCNFGYNMSGTNASTVRARFKVYGDGTTFPFTLSVGGSGSAAAAASMWAAVNGYSTYGEIPDIIIHARENIGDAGYTTLLAAYKKHVEQGGWLLYTAREWNDNGGTHTQLLLGSQGLNIATVTTATANASSLTISPSGTMATELVNGPFTTPAGTSYVSGDASNFWTFVSGLPSYCEKFVSGTGTYSSYAACFVCKKPEWKGGFIMLGTGTTAGYFAGYDANYYSMLTPYPYSVNARLEMNAMAYIVKQNRINDINQPNPKPVPINP